MNVGRGGAGGAGGAAAVSCQRSRPVSCSLVGTAEGGWAKFLCVGEKQGTQQLPSGPDPMTALAGAWMQSGGLEVVSGRYCTRVCTYCIVLYVPGGTA